MAAEKAKQILTHYFTLALPNANPADLAAEIDVAVDDIIEAATENTKRDITDTYRLQVRRDY